MPLIKHFWEISFLRKSQRYSFQFVFGFPISIILLIICWKYLTTFAFKFNQKELNKKRLIELKKLTPFLFESPLWGFELVSQTNGESREDCGPMFHGFIFTFRPNSTKETLDQEADYLEKFDVNQEI